MFKRKKNVFTLIELIATLVIMAIIALIATPLVMNIIRKARIFADKRSIDAYGRSIELAISSHLLDTGKFATSIDELTIEYSGNKVECETKQINPDSSVYLSNCKVNNREVTNYSYGSDKSPSYDAYKVGDEVTYKGVDYYVLKDSGAKDNVVTLLKAEPLTVEEVNTYGGVGTGDNHVNRYTSSSQGTAYNSYGYGGTAFYTSETCIPGPQIGCNNDYEFSDVKYIIDKWVLSKSNMNDLKIARLISKEEYLYYCNEQISMDNTSGNVNVEILPKYDWLYNSNYIYWTISKQDDSEIGITYINNDGKVLTGSIYWENVTVRPVVELYKNDGITRKNSGNN